MPESIRATVSKRYIFWRGPDAKPYKGQDGKFSPTELLADWGRTAIINAEGKPSWQGFGWRGIETALNIALAVIGPDGTELGESDTWQIARRALADEAIAIGGQKPIDPKKFIDRANDLAADYFRRPEESFVLVTTLSLRSLPFKSVKVCGCRISRLVSRKYRELPRSITEGSPSNVYKAHVENTKYTWITVETSGRSWEQAVKRALNAVTLLRSLWTIAATYGRATIYFGHNQKPLSVVHTGLLYTLHRKNGKPVDDNAYWIESSFVEEQPLFEPDKGWKNLEHFRRSVMRRLKKLPHRVDIEQLLVRYVAALDNTDYDLALLQMWTILEKITDTVGGKYDETIKRASWFFKDRVKNRQLLECIRIQRNRYVHSSQASTGADQAAHLIKALVEPHLLELISNNYSVSSVEEYARVFSLPVELGELKRLRKHVTLALKALRPKASKKSNP